MICYYDGKHFSSRHMTKHCDRKHAGHVRKLRAGEEPYLPYCSNWLEVAQSLGAVKPDCLTESISVSAIEICSKSNVSQALPTERAKS